MREQDEKQRIPERGQKRGPGGCPGRGAEGERDSTGTESLGPHAGWVQLPGL